MPSDSESAYLDTPLEPADQDLDRKPSVLKEHITDAEAKEALRTLLLQRFSKWLDDVLTDEKPLDGIAAELLAELEDESFLGTDQAKSHDDLYSTWSAMTALTQEIKLQGRAFKQLTDKMELLVELDNSMNRFLESSKEALSAAMRIAEEGREERTERENKIKLEAREGSRREVISVMIDIRDKLFIGLRSAAESQRKLDEYRNSSWLQKMFIYRIARVNHMFEIIHSLKKGYRIGLERLDEALQQLGIHEIVCEGKQFDPRIMNAVDVEETAETPDGTVLEVYRTGYMIDTEVLQPAQVKVSRAPLQRV